VAVRGEAGSQRTTMGGSVQDCVSALGLATASAAVLANHAQAQFVLSLNARRDTDPAVVCLHDEMLTRRRVDVVHDVRETRGDVGADFFERIVDHAVGLPVRAPVAVIRVLAGIAVIAARDAGQLRVRLRLQVLEIGGVDDVFERGTNIGRLGGLGGLRCVRGTREQQG
jgi:hypothetical protein